MKNKLKRLISLLSAVIMVFAILPKSETETLAKTTVNSVLKWDFESKSDIGYYYQGQTEAEERKAFESGTWCREAGTWNGTEFSDYMRPVQTKISATGMDFENGGRYCAGLTMISAENNRRTLGMAIMLSEKELIPGRRIMLEFDAYNNLSWERFVFAGFSSPSDRTASTRACDSDGVPWFVNGGYCEQVIVDDGEKKGISNDKWSHASVVLTPPEEMYEDGHIILYIAASNWLKQYVAGNEKIYFDNITVTPLETSVEKPVYSEINYGRMWDCEDEEPLWGPLNSESDAPQCIAVTDALMYKNELANHGYNGAAAPGSQHCIEVAAETVSNYILGAKIGLSNSEFREGKYKLELRAAANSAVYNLNAAVFKGDADIVTVDSENGGALVDKFLKGASSNINMGVLSTHWSRYTADISLTETDFSEEGYCTLVIYSGVGLMETNEKLYLDDISLVAELKPGIESGKSIAGYLTTVSDCEIGEARVIAAVKADNALKEIASSPKVLNGIKYINFSVKVPDKLENTQVELYMWENDTLTPIDTVKDIGVNYIRGDIECRWHSEWIDVLGTRCDEVQNPTVQTDNSKTARITVDKSGDIVLSALVYDDNGDLYSSGVGRESFNIDVPSQGEYTVSFEGKNINELIVGTVGTYTKDEFEKLTAYPIVSVPNVENTVYRASFEYDYLDVAKVSDGVQYVFSERQANGGNKCLYISGRTSNNQGLEISVPDLAGSKAEITAYIRNDDSVGSGTTKRYLLSAVITPVSGTAVTKTLTMASLKGNEDWLKITANADFTAYTAQNIKSIKFYLAEVGKTSFYVDDVLIVSDGTGDRHDDNMYSNYALDMISDTPYVQSSNAEDLRVDESLPALKDVFKDYFKLGGCNNNQMCDNDPYYADVFWKNFNTTVADGSFKEGWLCRDGYEKPYSFELADEMMYFCYNNGLDDIVGHAIIGDKANLGHFSDENGELLSRDESLAQMEDYIKCLINHFNGKGDPNEYWSELTYDDYKNWHITTWDVVNEPAASGYNKDGFGIYRCDDQNGTSTSVVGYCRLVGKDYIQYAYKYAREADPTAELRLNDFEDWYAKRENIIQIVAAVNGPNNIAGGKQLVDKIGYQCHFTPDMEPAYLRDTVELFVGTGLPLDITEVDLRSHSFEPSEAGLKLFETGITKMREFEQAMLLKGAFEIFKEYSADIDRVTFWTITDRYMYYNNTRTDYAGIFDRNFKPKPAFWAIVSTEAEFYERYPEAKLLFEKTEWHFDYISDVTYSFDMGAWTRIDPELYEHQPLRAEDGDGNYYLKTTRRWRGNNNEGIRIKLSKNQLKPGKKYTLSFKSKVTGTTAESESGRDLYVALAVPSSRAVSGSGAAEFITSGTKCGTSSTEWQTYTAEIAPTIDDYENGYTSLYLSMPGGFLTGLTANLCFDDITIEEIN